MPPLQSHGRGDKLWMRIYVFVTWVLDAVHQIVLLASFYTYLVKDIGNLLALKQDTS